MICEMQSRSTMRGALKLSSTTCLFGMAGFANDDWFVDCLADEDNAHVEALGCGSPRRSCTTKGKVVPAQLGS